MPGSAVKVQIRNKLSAYQEKNNPKSLTQSISAAPLFFMTNTFTSKVVVLRV